MTQGRDATVHASAVKIGNTAVLIRGPSGSGKSRLAFELIMSGRSGQVPPAVLVGDDRVHLDTAGGELLVRPAAVRRGPASRNFWCFDTTNPHPSRVFAPLIGCCRPDDNQEFTFR